MEASLETQVNFTELEHKLARAQAEVTRLQQLQLEVRAMEEEMEQLRRELGEQQKGILMMLGKMKKQGREPLKAILSQGFDTFWTSERFPSHTRQ